MFSSLDSLFRNVVPVSASAFRNFCLCSPMVLLYCKQKSLFQELLNCLYYRLCFQILHFWIYGNNPMITRLKLSWFPDEEDELSGESHAGLTDDEGIEDDHEEVPVVKAEEGKTEGRTVRKSGTCDSLISLCR